MALDLGGGLNFTTGDLLGGVGALSALGGGITQALGAAQTARGQRAAYRAQAQGYRQEAEIAGDTAGQAWYATSQLQQRDRYLANQLVGKQQAAFGAAGVAPTGSVTDVAGDTEGLIQQEARNRFYAGRTAAHTAGLQYGYDQQAAAAADEAAKKVDATSGILGGILGGVGSAAKIAMMFL